jgi:sugar phosphate isomerase/epimerase
VAVPRPVLFSTAAFFARPLADICRLVKSCGYDAIEVMVTKDPDSQDPRRISELAREHGLTVGALHAPNLLLTRRIWGTDPIGKIYRSIEVAESAGIPLVVVHPPYRWQLGYRRWLDARLPALSERTGVTVAIENMFPLRLGEKEVTLHANQDLDELEGLPDLVLDTSHAAVARHDLGEVRARFGNRLRHVHLSDNAGRGWDSHLPPGEGVVDLEPFLRGLAAEGFQGSVSLEVDLRQHLTEAGQLREAMISMRRWVESRLKPVAHRDA